MKTFAFYFLIASVIDVMYHTNKENLIDFASSLIPALVATLLSYVLNKPNNEQK